jgi:ATP-dependent protease HslVU (ClpYQ) peptidase subunit
VTCIVGIAEKGKVWIGGDSQATRNGTKVLMTDGKVAQNGEFLIGVSGTARFCTLARHTFQPPGLSADADVDEYMAAEFADAWRACLKENGASSAEDGLETFDGMLLIGVRGRLYEIDGCFAVIRPLDSYSAVGSGDNIALGALHATAGMPPEKRIRLALAAAEKWDDGVAAPFHIKSVGGGKG